MPAVTAIQLYDDYKYYWRYTRSYRKHKQARSFVAPPRFTKDKEKLFSDLISWCDERGFNPRIWLYALFVSRRWTFAPRLLPSHLQSKKQIEHYENIENYEVYRKRIDQEIAQKHYENIDTENQFDPNRDLSNASEGLKAALLRENNPNGCMELMETDTFGYHPRSQVCNSCPAMADCAQRLVAKYPFDILALRRGEITSSACRAIALDKKG